MECPQELQLLSREVNFSNNSFIADFPGRVVKRYPEEAFVFDGNQLINLFKWTFGPLYLDNCLQYLARRDYCSAMPVRSKLSKYGSAVSPTYPICLQDREAPLYNFVECLE